MDLMPQKGSVLPLLLILLLASVLGVVFFRPVEKIQKEPQSLVQTTKQAPKIKVYEDKELNFQFEYPIKDFEVVPDDEESYFKTTATDHRKNFTGYVGYPPPTFIKGVAIRKADTQPVVLWVFDNPNKLSIDAWFDKYWYYPFVWGVFAQPGKGHIYPNTEATVSGQPAKSVIVSYQPGKPEFIYVLDDDKMFLFRMIKGSDEKAVNQILSTFKFTNHS